jgi:hypothetical protein
LSLKSFTPFSRVGSRSPPYVPLSPLEFPPMSPGCSTFGFHFSSQMLKHSISCICSNGRSISLSQNPISFSQKLSLDCQSDQTVAVRLHSRTFSCELQAITIPSSCRSLPHKPLPWSGRTILKRGDGCCQHCPPPHWTHSRLRCPPVCADPRGSSRL